MRVDAATRVELAGLRRRAYGPEADIDGDAEALLRLVELEDLARSEHFAPPALPALKMDCTSEADRARLKNSTSSMRPWKNRLGVPDKLLQDRPISTSRVLLTGAPLDGVVACKLPSR